MDSILPWYVTACVCETIDVIRSTKNTGTLDIRLRHYGLKVVFCLRHFTAYHHHHNWWVLQALKIRKCLWSLSCGGVPNMLLVLPITFHFHYYIWGCMCSTGPFHFRWLRGYIHSSCYYHHQIGSINLTHYHIFRGCVRCLLHHTLSLIAYTLRQNLIFVFIIIVQFMMSANSRIRFGLQIVFLCLYITPSHCHHCANLSEDIEW